MSFSKIILSVAVLLTISACGTSRTDRAVSGGAIGAAAGAAGAAILNKDAVSGGLIGGAVGAAAGAVTDESDVDLGKPIWK